MEFACDAKEGSKLISNIENKIICQLEYYFGNYNLSRDKFLKKEIQESDGGWIQIATLLKFNRLRKLSEDSEVIANAMKKAPNNLIEVSEDGSKIRRRFDKPIPDEDKTLTENKTVYVKGFNVDTTLDELVEFFKQHNSPANIFMRRKTPVKKFKGSVFVTFNTDEDTEKFLYLRNLKYKGVDLLCERKADYMKRKTASFEEVKKRKLEKQTKEKIQVVSNHEIMKGCLMKLKDLSSETTWEDIREALAPHGKVAFVDYLKGFPQAMVRFTKAVAAEVIEKASTEDEDRIKRIKVGKANAVAIIVEGEDEVEYWKIVASAKEKKRKQFPGTECPNRGGKHGKRRGKKRRYVSSDNSQTITPMLKVPRCDGQHK